jgi:hypothetical protein
MCGARMAWPKDSCARSATHNAASERAAACRSCKDEVSPGAHVAGPAVWRWGGRTIWTLASGGVNKRHVVQTSASHSTPLALILR